jgi:hypothetical protein
VAGNFTSDNLHENAVFHERIISVKSLQGRAGGLNNH